MSDHPEVFEVREDLLDGEAASELHPHVRAPVEILDLLVGEIPQGSPRQYRGAEVRVREALDSQLRPTALCASRLFMARYPLAASLQGHHQRVVAGSFLA